MLFAQVVNELYGGLDRGLNLDLLDEAKPDPERPVVVCDINADMLRVGKDRSRTILGNEKSSLVSWMQYCTLRNYS
jgi:hypothetical protein